MNDYTVQLIEYLLKTEKKPTTPNKAKHKNKSSDATLCHNLWCLMLHHTSTAATPKTTLRYNSVTSKTVPA